MKKTHPVILSAIMALWIPFTAAAQDTHTAPAAQPAEPTTTVQSAPSEVDYSILPEPMAFAKAQYAEALRLNALPASTQRDDQIRAFVDKLIDYDDYAKRSLGARWNELDTPKQAEFQSLFRELIELTYLKRLSDKAFKDNYKIDWDRVVKTRTSATVSCFTQQKDVETELEIVLHAVQNQWNIHDTLVDGASLVQTYQKKYAKKWDDKGIDAIMDDMKKEIETLKKK